MTETSVGKRAAAFTIVETLAAVAVVSVAMLVVAEFGIWGVAEQKRVRDQHIAQEVADNILEKARATPWDQLSPAWATQQQLPQALASKKWRLSVQVADEEKQPASKRVAVEVHWTPGDHPSQPVRLVGWFGNRSSQASNRSGDKP